MSWPQSQEYNEAIQSPAASFADPELRKGEAVTNDLGIPMPRSGNFADVYEVRCNGVSWAVKCFTREVPGLRDRYQEISRYLQEVKLPFTVDFTYLEQGIRVAGKWYPILKMQWIEGFTFNDFIRQQLDKPAVLGSLVQIWGRMATRLREAGIAHADLQHGNVLWVPGSTATSFAIRLIDYDGMYVPSLSAKKSGEVGHPSYQHPQRVREGIYSPDVDRFPVLLIAAALRALKVKGRTLWEKYDNGDNLLFRQQDLEAPSKSHLFSDLLKLTDPVDRLLVRQLIDATRKPLKQTPLLEELLPEAATLSIRVPSPPTPAPAVAHAPMAIPLASPVYANPGGPYPATAAANSHAQLFAFDDNNAKPPAPPNRGTDTLQSQKIRSVLPWLLAVAALFGMILLAGLAAVGIWVSSNRNSSEDNSRQIAKPDLKGSDSKKPLPTVTVDLGGGVSMEFILIDPKTKLDKGVFQMGAGPGDETIFQDEKPQHEVTITKPFYLAKHPVTQEQYRALRKDSPSYFQAGKRGADKVQGMNTSRFPVEEVSWDDAKAYCAEMTKKDAQGHKFRLPTEAEWEYACRAGTDSAYFFGDNPNNLGNYAWFDGNSENRTHEVGTRKPNPWGLYDMGGNVFQWCADYYGPYEAWPQHDPLQSVTHSGERRVLRGGSWDSLIRNCRAAYRLWSAADDRTDFVGFRVAFHLN